MSHETNHQKFCVISCMRNLFCFFDSPGAIKIRTILQSIFLLGVRLIWGYGFVQAGLGKIKNLNQVTEFFAGLGIPFATIQAPFVAGIELIGGALLILGLGSRLVAIPLAGTMIVAYLTAHRDELFGVLKDSEAFFGAAPFLFLFAMVIIILFGPGLFSLDQLIRSKWQSCEIKK